MSLNRSAISLLLMVAATVSPLMSPAAATAPSSPSSPGLSSVADLWDACLPQYEAVGGGAFDPEAVTLVKSIAAIGGGVIPSARAQLADQAASELAAAWIKCILDRREQQVGGPPATAQSTLSKPEEIADYIHACGPEVTAVVASFRSSGTTDFTKDSSGKNIYVRNSEADARGLTLQEMIQLAGAYASYTSFDLVDGYKSSIRTIASNKGNPSEKLRACMLKQRLSRTGSPVQETLRGKSYKAPSPKAAAVSPSSKLK